MLTILRPVKSELTSKGDPKPKLCLEDMLLATRKYLREYQTYAHVATSYEVYESRIFHITKWVENTLIDKRRQLCLT